MILAHLADLHLGYRAYHRLAPGGINARERDVALAFRAAVDRLADLRPDLVLVAGDVFHTVRPSNSAITDAFRQFVRLRDALGQAPIIIIAGNHDAPRSVEAGSILRLFGEIPGVRVVDGAEPRQIRLEGLDASVLCVPHAALVAEEPLALEPDPDVAVNIALLHGTVRGRGVEEKLRFLAEFGGAPVDLSELRPEQWTYVALGHYHHATALGPNAWYAGATERTATNLWEEAGEEKGFVTFDTTTGAATFHAIPTRPAVDLAPVSAVRDDGGFMEAAELDAVIRERVEEVAGGVEGKLVRLVVRDVPRELFRALDHDRLRRWKAEALHFHLDVRRPEVRRSGAAAPGGRRLTLEEEVETFLTARWKPTSSEVDPARLARLASQYLAEVSEEGA